MRGLTIVVASADRARCDAALTLAAAALAGGERGRLYFHGDAVRLLGDAPALLETVLELGGKVIACQTGLAEAAMPADALDPRMTTGGMVHLVTSLAEDRLVVV